MPRAVTSGAVSIVVLLALDCAVAAQTTFRLGVEFQVNTQTLGSQFEPAVARAPNGAFVVVWSQEVGASDIDIVGRRFDSLGTPQGAVFQVNAYTPFSQRLPDVSMDSGGAFVVTWVGSRQAYGSFLDLFARRFDAQGTPLGGEIRVNDFTPSFPSFSKVRREADGDFLVVWSSQVTDGDGYGIFGRHFNSSGVTQGVEFQLNVTTVGMQMLPSLAMEPDGDFIVAWADLSLSAVRSRRFTSSGAAGAETQVSLYTGGGQIFPAIGVDGDGDYVIAWYETQQRDGHSGSVFARRFNAVGGAEAVEFQVNTHTMYNQRNPSIDVAMDGSFVVAWESRFQDGSEYGAFARTFDASGAPRGGDFQVNTYTPNSQVWARVADDGQHGFVVVWHDYSHDGAGAGLFQQRYATLVALDVDGNGVFQALTDGLLVLRFGFGFTGQTLITGAVGAGCTRCDAASILAYLQSMS